MNIAIRRTMTFLVVLFLLAVVVLFAGCSAKTEVPTTEPSVAQPASEPEETPETVVDPMISALGEAFTYTNNVSISVSTPVPFQPTEYANGADQANQVLFTFVITNGTDKPLEPTVWATVSSGGAEGSPIIDVGNEAGQTSFGPSTTILPGQTIEWLQAFSIADMESITVEISPGFEYENAIFTNIPL